MNVGDVFILGPGGHYPIGNKVIFKAQVIEFTKETILLKDLDNGAFVRVMYDNIGHKSMYEILEHIVTNFSVNETNTNIA